MEGEKLVIRRPHGKTSGYGKRPKKNLSEILAEGEK